MELTKIYNADALKKMGYLYEAMLERGNRKIRDPFPYSQVMPVKAFLLLHNQMMGIGIPEEIDGKISDFMKDLDPDDFASHAETPCPMDLQTAFVAGRRQRDIEKGREGHGN